MGDTTVVKIDSRHSPRGALGQTYLASGVTLDMRLFRDEPAGEKDWATRDYETVGYAIAGRAELDCEGQTVQIAAGDSWTVPRGSRHRYRILEPFEAVEAGHPPASVHGRDGS